MAAEFAEVANWAIVPYHGLMPNSKYQTLEDFPEEFGFKDAYLFLRMSGAQISEATFARIVRTGRVRKHKRPLTQRPYYRKSELQSLLREDARRLSEETPDGE